MLRDPGSEKMKVTLQKVKNGYIVIHGKDPLNPIIHVFESKALAINFIRELLE